MRNVAYILVGAVLAVFIGASAYAEDAEDGDEGSEIDLQQVLYGDPGDFENAAEVDLWEAVKATPEYAEIERRGLGSGDGSFWLQIERGSNRSLQAAIDVGKAGEFDLIVKKGHLAEVDEDISVEDITDEVVSYIEDM